MPFPKFMPSFTAAVPISRVHQHCIKLMLLPKFALLLISLATAITESKVASLFMRSASAIIAGVDRVSSSHIGAWSSDWA